MTSLRFRLTVAAGVALFAASLAGCGKTGLLEQPAPMFGAQAKAQYAQQKKDEADARARASAARKAQQNGPIVDDPDSQPAPNGPYTPPNPSHLSDPFAQGPQGALPTPGTTPDR
jgi:predicted small lipoprotein YifL